MVIFQLFYLPSCTTYPYCHPLASNPHGSSNCRQHTSLSYQFKRNIVERENVIESHRVHDALETVAFPVLQGDGLHVAVLSVARVESEAVEGRLVADVLVHHEGAGLLGRAEAVETFFVNL